MREPVVNQQPEHLSDAQITEYLSESGEGSPVRSNQWMEAHLEGCEECTRRVLSAFPVFVGFGPRDRVSAGPDPECPLPETLDEIAAGIASSEITAHNLRHVSDCDFCGPLLRDLLEQYSPNVAPEDEALLAEVQKSAKPWRKMMVRKIMEETKPDPGPSWWALMMRPWVLAGTTAATLLTGVGLMTVPAMLASKDLKKADSLLAAASTAHDRITPVRVTAVPYSDYHPQLGPGDSVQNNILDDSNFLQAKILVKSKIASASGRTDPRWLQLKARIALMEGGADNLKVAEKSLNEAIARASDNPSLRIDLAATYFKQDFANPKSSGQLPPFARTIDVLNDILKKPGLASQDKAVALFDLAYASEQIGLLDTEDETWSDYLKLDSSGDWAREAREARERLKKVVKIPTLGPQVEDPSGFLGLSDKEAEARLEQYIDIALRKWLHPAVEFPSGDEAHALRRLAEMTAAPEHFDPLLKDFLGKLTKADLPAIDALSAARENNLNDHYDDDGTELKSNKAARWFAGRGNLPGELLIGFETTYRIRRGLKGTACLPEIKRMSSRLPAGKYHWLEGQVMLEMAQCANLLTDYKQAETSLLRSREIAKQYDFPDLSLRVMGIEASIKRLQRDYQGAWLECMKGLEQYWKNPRSPERLYQFYSVLSQTARDSNLPRAAEALLRQQIKIRENYFKGDTLMLATLHMRLADNLRDDETPGAISGEVESETKQAMELVREAPNRNTGQKYLLYGEILFADKKLQRAEESTGPEQKRQQALLALQSIEPVRSLLDNQDDFLQLDFHRVRANAERQLGRMNEAVVDYQSALERSELALRAIRDNVSRARWILKTDEIDHGLTWTLLRRKEDTKALYVWERLRSRSLAPDNDGDPPLKSLELENAAFVPAAPPVSEMHL